MRFTKKDINKVIQFLGFDGQHYRGKIVYVGRQVVEIEYRLKTPLQEIVTAYLEKKDQDRLDLLPY